MLKVCGSADSGYSAELLLTARTIWEAVLQAKAIKALIKDFKDYDLKIK